VEDDNCTILPRMSESELRIFLSFGPGEPGCHVASIPAATPEEAPRGRYSALGLKFKNFVKVHEVIKALVAIALVENARLFCFRRSRKFDCERLGMVSSVRAFKKCSRFVARTSSTAATGQISNPSERRISRRQKQWECDHTWTRNIASGK
jgi:hypothetical protein